MGLRTRLLLFICCFLPQMTATVFQKEIFPWSPFPMYSGADLGDDLTLLGAFVVTPNGDEIPLERVLRLRPKYEYRWRIPADEIWRRPMRDEERGTLERFAGIFDLDLRESGQSAKALRFYLEHWNHFEGPKRRQPDERRLLHEHALEP